MGRIIGKVVTFGFIALVIGGIFLNNSSNDSGNVDDDIDLNAILDVTIDTIYAYEENSQGVDQSTTPPDAAFLGFTEELGVNLNSANPRIFEGQIGLSPQTDASIYAFEDKNFNKEMDDGELGLFIIEIDGENSRVIASSRSGAVNDHHFSGTGILTGYLIGSMLGRQRAAGINPKSLASKRPVTAKAAARSRAGSGSHSKGK